MQLLALKVTNALNIFTVFNTKVFLGFLFISIISIYGLLFKILQIDLLRLKKQKNTYWLTIEEPKNNRILKGY